jgi:hypothetical protein
MVSIENLDEREWVEWKEDEPEPVLQMTEMVEAIHKAVDLLPTRYKEAFKARHFLGLSYEQIATDMKIPVEVARNYVNRALRQIKNAMSQPIWVVLLVRIAFILSLSLVFRKSIVIQHANYNHLNLSHAKNHKGMG